MMQRPPIPANLDDVNVEWLESALNAEGRAGDVAVSSATVAPVQGTTGLAGVYALVDLEYSRPTEKAPNRVFIKIIHHPDDAPLVVLEVLPREVHWLREYSHVTNARTPAFYYGDYTSDARSGVIITEALDDWEMGSITQGIGLPKALAIARTLGELHGSTIGNSELRKDKILEPSPAGSPIYAQGQQYFAHSLAVHAEELEHFASPDLLKFAHRIENSVAQLFYESRISDPSLNHGDCRVDNMGFQKTEQGWNVVLYDFGLGALANGLVDLAQSISTAFSNATLDELKQVVQCYRESAQSAGSFNYSFDETWHKYRKAMLYSFMFRVAVVADATSLSELENGSPLEQMRFTAWNNVMHHSEALKIWDVT